MVGSCDKYELFVVIWQKLKNYWRGLIKAKTITTAIRERVCLDSLGFCNPFQTEWFEN